MAFYVGQKVVCVDDSNGRNPARRGPSGLVKGHVYTISSLDPTTDQNGDLGVHVVEVVLPFVQSSLGYNVGFNTKRFRPAVERKTDISIFTAMLTDKRIPAHVHD